MKKLTYNDILKFNNVELKDNYGMIFLPDHLDGCDIENYIYLSDHDDARKFFLNEFIEFNEVSDEVAAYLDVQKIYDDNYVGCYV